MKNSFNQNVMFYARANTPITGLYRHRQKFKFLYFTAFFFTFLVHLAYILGLWLQSEADGTPAAQNNLWFCVVFVLVLAAGALCICINRPTAGLVTNCLSAVVLLVGVWGNLFFADDTSGIKVADGILCAAPIALLLLVLFCVLYCAGLALHRARVQKNYDRILSAVYKKAAQEAGGTPCQAALQAAMEAYTGQDPALYGKTKLSRSEKARLRKQ